MTIKTLSVFTAGEKSIATDILSAKVSTIPHDLVCFSDIVALLD